MLALIEQAEVAKSEIQETIVTFSVLPWDRRPGDGSSNRRGQQFYMVGVMRHSLQCREQSLIFTLKFTVLVVIRSTNFLDSIRACLTRSPLSILVRIILKLKVFVH